MQFPPAPVWSVSLILKSTIVSVCRSRFISRRACAAQNTLFLDINFALVYPFDTYNSIEKSPVDYEPTGEHKAPR